MQQELDDPFFHVGIDRIIGMMTAIDKFNCPIQEIQMGPFAQKINETLKEIVLTLAQYFQIHDPVNYDIELDSSEMSIKKMIQIIKEKINSIL